MKELKTIINKELKDNENIFITTESKLNDLNNKEWWKFEEYTIKEVFSIFNGKEKVKDFWHEDGLCIILKELKEGK